MMTSATQRRTFTWGAKHGIINKLVWLRYGYNLRLNPEERWRKGLHSYVEAKVKDGEIPAKMKVKVFRNGVQEEAEEGKVSAISNGNYVTPVEDTCGPFALITLLKACVVHRDLDRGSEIHMAIVRRGLLENVFVGSTLVSMYTKCGALVKAREVFDELPLRSVVSWTALISGFVQHGLGKEALDCFKQMQLDGLSPNAVTFACVLRACGDIGASDKGEDIHVQVVTAGLLAKEIVVGTALVDMYAKCGLLAKAQEVFDELPFRNAVSWNALIAGYVQLGQGEKAFNCLKHMQHEGVCPEAVTFSCILKACSSSGLANKGQELHAQIAAVGSMSKDVVIGTALVDMYAKCGMLGRAQAVFDELPVRNIVLWTALIAGYALHGHYEEALNCFEQMQCGCLSPDSVAFDCVLKACGTIGDLDKGQDIHAKIVRHGFLQETAVGTSLVDMYAKCGKLEKAQEVFEELSHRNVVSWNALIAGYAQHGHGENALHCFETMQCDGISPDAVIFASILQACGSIGAADKGQEVHTQIVTAGLLEDIVLGSAIVDMYAKCGLLGKAQEVFDELPSQSVFSWTALISGYVRHGHNEEALKCFEGMQVGGLSPDAITYACVLKACGNLGASDKGKEIHARIVRDGFREEGVVQGALIDMFTKFGLLAKAQEVLEELSIRTLVSWTTLIAAYVQHGQIENALICFERMQHEGLSLDAVTIACILKACGSLGALNKGKEIHAIIARNNLLDEEIMVGNALIDMYSKCGLLQKAQEVFNKLLTRDIITWNAVIAGHAQLGKSATVFNLLNTMLQEGEVPDLVTFTVLLNTCSHLGLLDEGQLFFMTMSSGYGIVPNLEHHTCMIDLFCRAGHLEKAVALIQEMPFSANHTVWSTLLGACHKWGDMKIGSWAYEHAVQLDEKHTAAYVSMSNIYAAANMQEEALPGSHPHPHPHPEYLK